MGTGDGTFSRARAVVQLQAPFDAAGEHVAVALLESRQLVSRASMATDIPLLVSRERTHRLAFESCDSIGHVDLCANSNNGRSSSAVPVSILSLLRLMGIATGLCTLQSLVHCTSTAPFVQLQRA